MNDATLHVDEHLIIAVKPAGLLAVPGRGEAGRDCFSARLQQQWPELEIVHRLDMGTSGLMVFARGKAAQRQLSMAFASRQVAKRYVATVDGLLDMPGVEATIELPLIADWPQRPRQKVDFEQGKPSLTRYRVLAHDTAAHTSRVQLEPITGRSHQLRVHLMAIGHAILGDELYAPPTAHAKAERLLLHACGLAFDHPVTGEPLRFANEPPF